VAVECHVHIVGEDTDLSLGWTPVFTFLEVPRIGEVVGFVSNRRRDEDGVYRADRYSVQRVIHIAATDYSAASITIDVVLEQSAHEDIQAPSS
jgi:hypothetical protein